MDIKKRAAIDVDECLGKPLEELSAVELITTLERRSTPQIAAILTDKKKYELWVEENPLPTLRLGELLEKLKLEKKKVELELPFDLGEKVNPVLPHDFIDRVADAVAKRIRG